MLQKCQYSNLKATAEDNRQWCSGDLNHCGSFLEFVAKGIMTKYMCGVDKLETLTTKCALFLSYQNF